MSSSHLVEFKGNVTLSHIPSVVLGAPVLKDLRKSVCPQFPKDSGKASSVKLLQCLENWVKRGSEAVYRRCRKQ